MSISNLQLALSKSFANTLPDANSKSKDPAKLALLDIGLTFSIRDEAPSNDLLDFFTDHKSSIQVIRQVPTR
jgi:hypothetical protein